MKRTIRDRNEPSLVPFHSTAPVMRDQRWFRNQNESQSVNKALIRNNNLQLSVTQERTKSINPASLSSSGVPRGQFRPHLGGLNQHQPAWPTAMNVFSRFPDSGRQMARFLQPRCLNIRSPAVNYYSRANPARIPSTTHQFQETQRNAMFAQQRKYITHSSSTSSISTSERSDTKNNLAKGQICKNKISMHRKWQALPKANQCGGNEFSFSLITYNLLSDALMNENIYLYEECSEDALDWESRREKLLEELLGYDAEILCLQEVEACHYENWFLPKLREAGYTGVYNQRTGRKPDGCAIFYRNDNFTLVKKKLVKYFTPKVYVLDKDNVGIVLLLKANTPDPENQFICVANTHLLFNKKRGDIKLAQLVYLFAEIDELAVLSQDHHKKTHCPVILCGDLNSLPYSPLYHFVTTGHLNYSVRSPAVISGQLPPSEACHKRPGKNTRPIRTPLLPWEFGVTTDCQWREQCQDNSNVSCMNSQDTACLHESNRLTGHIQGSESNTGRQNNAEDRNLHPSNNPTQVYPSGDNQTNRHVDTWTCSHAPSRAVNDSRIDKDSTRQTKPGPDKRNRELPERGVKATDTSQIGGFNKLDSHMELNRLSNCSPDPGSHHRHSEQRQRRQEHVQSCSQDREHSRSIRSNSDPDWTTVRRSKANLNVIDLTKDDNSPSFHNVVSKPSRTGTSHSNPDLDRSTKSNQDDHFDTLSSPGSARPTDGETERTKHNKNGSISIPWQLTSVYSHRFPDGNPEVTTRHSNACCNVDYIFYTVSTEDRQSTGHKEHVQTGKLTLLGRLELMRKADISAMRLPNHIFPSDHLSLQARFKLS